MKYLMATTALALLVGSPAAAQDHRMVFGDQPFDAATNIYASDLIGARVYATETDLNAMTAADADQRADWDDIGEINELVLTREGSVQSVLVGVGGFLGIGERDVAVNMSELRFVSDGDDPDDYFLVINANAAAIEEAPPYERRAMADDAMTADGSLRGDMQMESDPLLAPEIARDGYRTTMIDELTAEDLTGARVYGPNDEDVGEVGELLLADDGQIDRAVIDVGGFLGIGERPVAVSFDQLTLIRSDDGNDLRVYIDSSEEALEALPAYER